MYSGASYKEIHKDLPYDEKVKLQNLEHHPDIDTYVEEELHGKALLNPISTIKSIFGPALEKNHFHIFIKKPVFTVAFKFHEIYNIINELIENRIQQATPSHVAEYGKELTELCSLGIREGDILRFKKTYTKLLNTEVILSFKRLHPAVFTIIDKKAYKSLSELEIDIITHVAKQQCVTSLEQDSPNTRERVGQTIKALEIEHIIGEFEYLQWENRWGEIKKAILEKQMPNINSNVQFEVWRNNVKLGKVSDMIKQYLKKG
ncbi:unnamed protein product [Rhizophagus irregularis]|nr:unnamed protein product [Rhizophagus irregularis]